MAIKNNISELLAAAVSSLHASRTFDMYRMMSDRDLDGNILSDEPTEIRTYNYATGLIPARRMEELLCLISKDYRQSLMVFHQLVQGIFLLHFIQKQNQKTIPSINCIFFR